MATATTTPQQSSGLNRRRQWWRRIPTTCCRKEILILLVWLVLYDLPRSVLAGTAYVLTRNNSYMPYIYMATSSGSHILAPFIGWLADVKFGRYKVIIYSILASFCASIFYSVVLIADEMFGEVLSCIGNIVDGIGSAGFTAAILPFMTDQIIGATADELSSIVWWYYWFTNLSAGLAQCIMCTSITFLHDALHIIAVPCAACLAMIIISNCLCQQGLDRNHKITNPIKLVIQVLNYARKNRYPQRRSALTYLDEEQPSSRLDFGKQKFGGPFTEEEVEDVKTVLRLLPLVACLGINLGPSWHLVNLDAFDSEYINCMLNSGVHWWIAPLLLVPLCQFLLYPLLHKWVPSMLRRIGMGLFLQLVGFALCVALVIKEYTRSGDLTRYLTCNITETPDEHMEWYWRLVPLILYSVGTIFATALVYEFAIAQSPDKMKGLVIGMILAFMGFGQVIYIVLQDFLSYNMCYDITVGVLLTVMFLVFLFLSKHYTLRERNREVNIQAIVEEHYERYLDQEEEYMRERHY